MTDAIFALAAIIVVFFTGYRWGHNRGCNITERLFLNVWYLSQTYFLSRTYNRCMGITQELIHKERDVLDVGSRRYLERELRSLKRELEGRKNLEATRITQYNQTT